MKILISILFLINIVYAQTNIVVSILPQQTFVEKIGGDKVKVRTMVKPGSDPHSYEPKPSQMKDISNANIYFPIGLEFENTWLDKFADQNKNMKFIETHYQQVPKVLFCCPLDRESNRIFRSRTFPSPQRLLHLLLLDFAKALQDSLL